MNKSCLFFLVGALLFSCSEDDEPQDNPLFVLPGVQAVTVSEAISVHEATVMSKITWLATDSIEDHGFVYATESISALNPTGTKVSLGPIGVVKEFSSHITGLEKARQYYVRAYAATADTTVFGGQVTLTTKNVNQWFSYPVNGFDPEKFYEFDGLGLTANGKGYVGFGSGTAVPLHEYDPLTNTMTKMPDSPAPYNGTVRRFSVNNKIYLFTNPVWRFDPAVKEWKQLSAFVPGLESPHTFNLYGQAYAISNNEDNKRALEIWQYNEVADQWGLFSTVPFHSGSIPGDIHGVMQVNNKVYIIMAMVTNNLKLYEFDPVQGTYTLLKTPPMVLPMGSTRNYAVSSSAYGFFFLKDKNEIWRYNPVGDEWSKIDSPPSGLNVFILNDVIYSVFRSLYMYVIE